MLGIIGNDDYDATCQVTIHNNHCFPIFATPLTFVFSIFLEKWPYLHILAQNMQSEELFWTLLSDKRFSYVPTTLFYPKEYNM